MTAINCCLGEHSLSWLIASWWASSLSPFMAWLQHSEHLSICGLCGAGAELPGAARVTKCGESPGSLSLLALYWSRHGAPPSLSSPSVTSLATIRHRTPGLHLIPALPGPPWSQHYLDLAIRGLFPLISKTLRIHWALGRGHPGDESAGIIYTALMHHSHISRVSTHLISHHPGIIMSLFALTNARVRNVDPLSQLDTVPPSSQLSRQFVEKPQ